MTSHNNGDNNECRTICAVCGGDCCRTMPGIDSPERYLAAPDPTGALFQTLASGLWVLDRHYGLPPGDNGEPQIMASELLLFYPRPATLAERDTVGIMAQGGVGECVFLDTDGCRLSFSDRPRMCQALEPDTTFECTSSWTRLAAARAWLPLQELVATVLRRFPHDNI